MPESLRIAASPIHGRGVFAECRFENGDHIGTYEGPPTDVDGTHVLWIENGDDGWDLIDGVGMLRWLNHSSRPNVAFDGPDLFALRAIEIGEELTFDYGEDWSDVE